MSGELVPDPSAVRMSHAGREAVAERPRKAAGEGRLTLDEFEQRVSAALAARTFAEVEPLVADLPGGPALPLAPEHAELRTTAAGLKRLAPKRR